MKDQTVPQVKEVALWCRVSSKEQEDTGYSLPAQEKLLKQYAENKSFSKVKVFSVSESAGGKKQREQFQQMLKYVEEHRLTVIVCEKIDRLTRNLKDAVQVNEWIDADPQREVHFVKEGCVITRDSKSNEKFIWTIKVGVAEFYVNNLREEVKKGQAGKLDAGWLPTSPPVGYLTIGEHGHRVHVIDPDKAPFVKKMFELYATGNYSLLLLTNTIYTEGLLNANGHKIVKSRVHILLQEKFYVGINVWKGKEYPGKQETFISRELFDKVQSLLKRKNPPKYAKHSYLFKGLICCDKCGKTITWENQKSHLYGHCTNAKVCQAKNWITEPELEQQIIDALTPLKVKNQRVLGWIRKALHEQHKEEIEYHQAGVEELNNRAATLDKRLDKLYVDKLDGKISDEQYNRILANTKKEKDEIIQSLKQHSHAKERYIELGVNLFDLAQGSQTLFEKAKKKPERRQELIRLVFDELKLRDHTLLFSYSKAFQILLDAVQMTNCSEMTDRVVKPGEIFEPVKRIDDRYKKDASFGMRPTLLPD